ncbi:hypothetical protein pipiens_016567 [Culex pipiens pipiens]|uniref:Uncharacterized protein n=1 Tax=Culex pipiens pipiens TaxID=38569 RepID=A0ABD1CKR6_CULPP
MRSSDSEPKNSNNLFVCLTDSTTTTGDLRHQMSELARFMFNSLALSGSAGSNQSHCKLPTPMPPRRDPKTRTCQMDGRRSGGCGSGRTITIVWDRAKPSRHRRNQRVL